MTKRLVSIGVLLCAAVLLVSAQDRSVLTEQVTVERGTPGHQMPLHVRPANLSDSGAYFGHFDIVIRSPKTGCADTAACGEVKAHRVGHNMRTSAGTTWEYNQLLGAAVSVPMTYLGLSNTAITPAEADTSLSGELSSNGFTRQLATATNASGTLTVPNAPTGAVTGSTGTSYYYFGQACNQSICTTPSAASSAVSAAATLSSTAYVTATFTTVPGLSTCQIIRSNSSSAPSGSLAGGSTAASIGVVSTGTCSCANTSATVATCSQVDSSLTVNAYTVPASNLTNYGKGQLVYTWTATATQAVQAFGVFNAASSGTMFAEGTFTQSSMNSGDTFQLTWNPYF